MIHWHTAVAGRKKVGSCLAVLFCSSFSTFVSPCQMPAWPLPEYLKGIQLFLWSWCPSQLEDENNYSKTACVVTGSHFLRSYLASVHKRVNWLRSGSRFKKTAHLKVIWMEFTCRWVILKNNTSTMFLERCRIRVLLSPKEVVIIVKLII